jgi:hypothetical protein
VGAHAKPDAAVAAAAEHHRVKRGEPGIQVHPPHAGRSAFDRGDRANRSA